MTELLQNAFSLASRLPDSDQDAIAALIVAELESERKWDSLFSRSQGMLTEMAREAMIEHNRGETSDWFWIGSHADYDRLIKLM